MIDAKDFKNYFTSLLNSSEELKDDSKAREEAYREIDEKYEGRVKGEEREHMMYDMIKETT